MAIPLAYNLRNLAARRTTTLLTAVGIALAVAVLLASFALVNGLRRAFDSSGNPSNILVMRKGSTSELNSGMSREVFRTLQFKEGIAQSPDGKPMASLEVVTTITLAGANSRSSTVLRGLLPVGAELRNVRLQEGRWFQAGRREVVVGKQVARRYPHARTGSALRFGKGEWQVVGVMDGGESVISSEIIGDLNQVSSDFNRTQGLSTALVRISDSSVVDALIESLNNDPRLNVSAQTEKAYYDRQTESGAPLRNFGLLVAIILAVGSSLTAMNTMYAAVARRTSDIGTLRALGFSRASILLSFLVESLLLAALGGIIGCILVLPLNNLTTGVGNFTTVSEVAVNFTISPAAMLAGLGFALLMGAVGGVLPARMAANREILSILREH